MARGGKRLLLTAFEPFDDVTNASELVLRAIQARPIADVTAFEVVRCRSSEIAGAWRSMRERHAPRAALLLGQARDRGEICFETIAYNELEFSRPDLAGAQPRGREIVHRGPDSLASSCADLPGILRAAAASGAPCRLSDDAGRYLCNQLYFTALHDVEACFPVVFAHVPAALGQRTPPGISPLDTRIVANAVEAALEKLLRCSG